MAIPVAGTAGDEGVHTVADHVVRARAIESGDDRRGAGHGVLQPVELALGPVERFVEEWGKADVRPGGDQRGRERGQAFHPGPDFVDGLPHQGLFGGAEPDASERRHLGGQRVQGGTRNLVVAHPNRHAVIKHSRRARCGGYNRLGAAGALLGAGLRPRHVPRRVDRVADHPDWGPGM